MAASSQCRNAESGDILDLSLNEEGFCNALRCFCERNVRTFEFPVEETEQRRSTIKAILHKLTPGQREERKEDFIVYSLEALKILSRDKRIIEELSTEDCYFLFMELAGLHVRQIQDGDFNQDVEILDLPSLLKQTRIVIEALKCLCNVLFNSVSFQELCKKHECSKYLVQRLTLYPNPDLPVDIKAFDSRLMFLITALIPSERGEILEKGGLKLLVDALDFTIPYRLEREKEMKLLREFKSDSDSGPRDLSEELWRILQNIKNFSITTDQARVSAELLKVLFNVTLSMSKDEDETTDCCRLATIIRYMLSYCVPMPTEPENILSHAVNCLNNLHKHSYLHLIWKMPDMLVQEVRQDDKRRGIDRTSPTEYERYNMSAIKTILKFMEERIDSGISLHEKLTPVISVLTNICRFNHVHRRYVRQVILPPLKDVGYVRPEEGTHIKNKLIKLMTNPQIDVKEMVSEFLFVLCKENKDRMVKYTGYGNAAGFLFTQGIQSGARGEKIGEYSTDDEDSDTEEYLAVRSDIDPVLGAQHKSSPSRLDSMTEEEKEEEADKLVSLIRQLHSKGIIKPMFVDQEGETHEMTEERIERSIEDPSSNTE